MQSKKAIRAVVFDLDHTLFDRYATLSEIAAEMFRDFSGKLSVKSSSELANALIEADEKNIVYGFPKVYEHLCEKGVFKRNPDGTCSVTFDRYLDYILDKQFPRHAVAYPFALPVLKELRQMGLKIGLITNATGGLGHERQMSKLELLGLSDAFDEIVISCDVGFHKPDTRIFDVMTRRLGIPACEMLYVGDHPKNDVDASRRAGYIPVWVRLRERWIDGIPMCEYSIKDVSELLTLLEKINSF